ncbi:hypothetical protein SNOG_13501 [Parastagonospora nodorum SN15]|uniref:Uncharacterized protein n=1 Tax=Phaeosphaeria nodorum (strain SN15 / ATCC MYA-4574 / FGSC 10173) TaxID=321614 RepID=Q0U413_PHANO|nr:hypothetical protein SNOG_13501 [Parastagonospora nodorum SN15]EAT78948.1 hypothetical protein SNOG_13501 [Parastagonospora nodorum SN15]
MFLDGYDKPKDASWDWRALVTIIERCKDTEVLSAVAPTVP